MKQELEQAIAAACTNVFGTNSVIELTRPEAQFGDFSTNIALQLSKQLGKNPRAVAEELLAALQSIPMIQTVTIAGPGFINIRLSDEALLTMTNAEPETSLQARQFSLNTPTQTLLSRYMRAIYIPLW